MPSLYQALSSLERSGESGALATIVRTRGSVPRHAGCKMLIYPDGGIVGTVGGGEMESRVIAEAQAAIVAGETRMMHYALVDPGAGDPGVCGGEVEIFIEPVVHTPTVLVVGAGHVGRAVVHLAKWLGFRVVVADDRPGFAGEEQVPGADSYLPVPIADIPRQFNLGHNTFVVLTTRNMGLDVAGLPALLDAPAAYIGVIGSRRRWAKAVEMLEAAGMPRETLARVHSPMGLELNAETPEEIALSIMAEIVMVRNRGTGEAMRWKGVAEEVAPRA